MSTFANQVVLITGAASGIGRQLALMLAREGAVIAAVDLSADSLAKLEADLVGQRIASCAADVTDPHALRQAVKSLTDRVGPIDILIANAGIGLRTSARDFQASEFKSQIDVNLIGVANSIEAVLPAMLQRKQGHVVAISSLASYRGLPSMAGYCASKAGVNALMDSLRIELRDSGVAFTTICPGFIRTPLTTRFEGRLPMMRLEEACDRMIDAIRRRRAFIAFPRTPLFRLRLLRWLPLAWSDWLAAKYHRRYEEKNQAPSG